MMMETVGFILGQLLHTGRTNAICGDDVAPCLLSGDYAMVAIDEEEEKDGQTQRYTSAVAEKVLGRIPEPKPHD